MTKELYNELVKKGLITDTKMSFEYINKYNLTLEDIITIPAILELLTEKPVVDETKEETVVDETKEETVVDETKEETVVDETKEETVVDETKEEIVVDEPEVISTPKSKGKKNQTL